MFSSAFFYIYITVTRIMHHIFDHFALDLLILHLIPSKKISSFLPSLDFFLFENLLWNGQYVTFRKAHYWYVWLLWLMFFDFFVCLFHWLCAVRACSVLQVERVGLLSILDWWSTIFGYVKNDREEKITIIIITRSIHRKWYIFKHAHIHSGSNSNNRTKNTFNKISSKKIHYFVYM